MSAVDDAYDITDLLIAVKELEGCPAAEIDSALVRASELSHEAQRAGAGAMAAHLIASAFDRAGGLHEQALRYLLAEANDIEFRSAAVEGLQIQRARLQPGRPLELVELQAGFVPNADGVPIPTTTVAGERTMARFSCELEVLVNSDPNPAGGRRVVRRALCSAGVVAVTSERIIGLCLGRTDNQEAVDSAPIAWVADDGDGSVIAFVASHELFYDQHIESTFLTRNRPAILLEGEECLLSLRVELGIDHIGRLDRADRDTIAAAVRALING